jgi:hypothetical protein
MAIVAGVTAYSSATNAQTPGEIGNVVKRWEGFNNSAGGPARVFPGGAVMAANGARPPHQESLELVRQDFAGAVVWRFSGNEPVTTREGTTIRSARQHRDWRLESFPAGYYSPEVPLRSTAFTRSC